MTIYMGVEDNEYCFSCFEFPEASKTFEEPEELFRYFLGVLDWPEEKTPENDHATWLLSENIEEIWELAEMGEYPVIIIKDGKIINKTFE